MQWNDGSKTLFTTIPLEPSGPYPVTVPVTTDTARAVTEPPANRLVAAVPETFTLELTLEEMGFLRLLLTNATVQPAQLKKLCGEVQAKIEEHIGPLPPG